MAMQTGLEGTPWWHGVVIGTVIAAVLLGIACFAPRSLIEREFYSKWPIDINPTGDYHSLAMFFDRVSRLSRIINVENLRINARNVRSGSREETIAATFTAKTFVYKEPEE